jgi:Cu+-exporting ATPase
MSEESGMRGSHLGRDTVGAMETTVKDPVCGMSVDPARAAGSLDHGGHTYYFCSRHCLDQFRDEPERFIRAVKGPRLAEPGYAPAHPASDGPVIYTCPMHPEVVSDRPGNCPKCGMALEPRTAALEEGPSPELVE